MRHVGTEKKTVHGIEGTQERYRCDHCAGCALRDKCLKKPADFREVTVNEQWWYDIKPGLDVLLDSPDGVQRLKWRAWNVEPDFAHIKWAGKYERFRHFKRERCEMDFGIKALAVNLKKYFGRAREAALRGILTLLVALRRPVFAAYGGLIPEGANCGRKKCMPSESLYEGRFLEYIPKKWGL